METANGNKNRASTNGHRYAFDNFEIDPANRILLRDNVPIPLTSKVFDVLLVFAENPGRLLEKDELLEKVWHSDFVEEGNLARSVSTLRKALGDTGREHKYISTVQGYGYRFLADVISPDQITASNGSKWLQFDNRRQGAPKVRVRDTVRTHLYRRPVLLSLAGLCLIGFAVIAFRLEGSKPRQIDLLSFDRLRRTKLTQDGDVYGGVVSPNGQYLAYTRISGNEKALSVRQVATGSVLDLQPLQNDTSYWAMAFAPDTSFLYYIERESRADYGDLYRIPLMGGQRRKLIAHANGGLTFSPDGRKLAFTRIDRQKGTASIVTAETDGSNEQAISSSDLDSMFYSLDWAPDGNSFIYSFKRHEENGDYWYLAEIPVTGGEERRIGEASDSTILMAKWLPDKSGLIVNAIDEATRQPQVYSVSYPDGAKRRITNDLNRYVGFSMTADARSLVLPQTNSNREIWDLPGGKTNDAVQISNGTEKHFDSVSWAGNEYLVFDEDENSSFDNFNIYRSRPDGADLQQLTFGPGNNSDPAVSPDGQTIVFVSSRSGTRQLWRMNIDGRDLVRLTDLSYSAISPAFSQDGQTIFFSVSIAGKCNIWKISVNGGEPMPVIDADVYSWAVSPDSARLAYSGFDTQAKTVRTRIHSLVQGGKDLVLDIAPETWMEWSNDGMAIYFNTAQDEAQNIWRQPLDGSKPLPVTNFNTEQIFRFAWSPNGGNLACIRHTTTYDALILRTD